MDPEEIKQSLIKLLSGLHIKKAVNLQNPIVTGISYNSQNTLKGDVFVAIKGSKMDGHKFIHQAVEKGAVAVIGEENINDLNIPYLKVNDSRESLAILANNFFGNPSGKLTNIGITGTNGKTTTTYLINHILENAGYKTGLIGTIINKVNKLTFPARLTTPESSDIQGLIWKMAVERCAFVSMEVSSQGLAYHRVNGLHFYCGAVTNIGLDHTDCHPDFTHYLNTKLKFTEMIDNYLFLNADDFYFNDFKHASRCRVISYGIDKSADVKVIEYKQDNKGSFFVVRINKPITTRSKIIINPQIIPMFIKILGKHNIYNTLIAMLIALINDIPLKTITKSLAQFKPISRRCEIVYNNDIVIIDDTALNPNSYDALFATIKNLYYRKLIVVNAIRGNRGPEINMANAKKIAYWAETLKIPYIISTNSKSNVGLNDLVTPLEERSFLTVLQEANIKFKHFAELSEAIQIGLANTKQGDILLLTGAQGMDDGAAIALNLLKEKESVLAR